MKMTYALLLLLGITCLPAGSLLSPSLSPSSCKEHSTRASTDSFPPGRNRVPAAAHGAKETRQEVTVLGGELTPQPQHDL